MMRPCGPILVSFNQPPPPPALQIASEAAQLKNAGFALGEVTGGHGFKGRLGQAEVVLGGVDLLVAAPKRLATFVEVCGVVAAAPHLNGRGGGNRGGSLL